MRIYLRARSKPELRIRVSTIFKDLCRELEHSKPMIRRPSISVSFGVGKGNMAHVPWIAFLDSHETETTTSGVYCCYLFKADMSGVYLTFNQGIGKSTDTSPTQDDLRRIAAKATELRKDCLGLREHGFRVDNQISLADTGNTGKGYEKSTIAYKYYPHDKVSPDSILLTDIEYVLEEYDRYLARKGVGGKHFAVPPKAAEVPTPLLEFEELPTVVEPTPDPPASSGLHYSVEQFAQESGYPTDQIRSWSDLLVRRQHVIFYGPPGTGKTYLAERLARLAVSTGNGFYEIVQFHPAYTYEDFIQGYFPKPVPGGISFELKLGRFLAFCKRVAEKAPNSPCVILIDEINRAHVSRVFGELLYLLEYRERDVMLASSDAPFRIPKNVFILGTMNTADRSIALVDHALRRRFSFVRIGPEYEVLSSVLRSKGMKPDGLVSLLKDVNAAVDDPNYEMGISFFLNNPAELRRHIRSIWLNEIEPYLEEYFFDQPAKMKRFRWDSVHSQYLGDLT